MRPERRTLLQRAKDKESKVKFQSLESENQNENASSLHSSQLAVGEKSPGSDKNSQMPVIT